MKLHKKIGLFLVVFGLADWFLAFMFGSLSGLSGVADVFLVLIGFYIFSYKPKKKEH